LIEAVAKTNKNTIVVLNVGAPVLMGRWIDQVPAALNAWFGGEEVGTAIAAVLFGDQRSFTATGTKIF
jgi:beta-glucosidase